MMIPVVVCIDDEKIVLDSLKSQLEVKFNDSFQVEISESGEEALDLIEELISEGRDIPIVICDYLMPHMKGDVLLTKIKFLCPSTSCILLTGQATLNAIKTIVNNGVINKFIQKPWDIEYLCSTIEGILHESKISKIKNYLHENDDNSEISSIKSYIKNASEKINSALITIHQNIDSIKKVSTELPKNDFETNTVVDNFYAETSQVLDDILSEFSSIKKKDALFPGNILNLQQEDNSAVIYNCISSLMERVSNIEKKITLGSEKIAVWKDDEMFVFNISDIVCFTSENRNTLAMTNNDKYKVKETLDSLENRLNDLNFFRCHRCYLVNMNNIIKITPWLGTNSYIAKLKGLEVDIPISRFKIKKLKQLLGLECR
ncbi:LytTR family transcriptional regulator DNA-binding domain-containing protein [Herbivorax sp. ANBcel31]|uniref:response regulator transcription factor n=1 Tax=Herbivorax sp. ANBcel31 TaxID=3069754 RepID=UPI0027AF59B2|nr:LytTR family transcriptional regulator DNA-binding domain-containing protein [Herbivorax sp. ANBcel31]MDQ2084850.1 LytTR family transcriptional regulator DNA-binding domain-containing protein [Herbivorax sp. ANBcel31]